jgi:hypothetical protein
MRIVTLLAITLLGGVAGFFAGGYAYNLGHPSRSTPSGAGPGLRDRGLQAAHLAVADALERHRGRHNWLIGGALGGAGIGFVGTVLVSRVGHSDKRRGPCDTDIPA